MLRSKDASVRCGLRETRWSTHEVLYVEIQGTGGVTHLKIPVQTKKAFVIMCAKSVKDKIWQCSSQHSSYQCESREKNGLWNDSEATAIFRRETDRIVFRSVESKARVVLCSS